MKVKKQELAFQSYLTQLAEKESHPVTTNATPLPQSQDSVQEAEDDTIFTKVSSSLTPSRFMNRKKIKQEIRHNKSVIKRKFDKTYKQLSL